MESEKPLTPEEIAEYCHGGYLNNTVKERIVVVVRDLQRRLAAETKRADAALNALRSISQGRGACDQNQCADCADTAIAAYERKE